MSPMSELRPGDRFADKYLVERTLGEGGMGVVLAARHEALGERVAIKVLQPDLAGKPEVVGRFLTEAQSAAKIRSEHVVRVMDVGTFEGAPFMIMEYLEGADLAHTLRRRGQLPVDNAVDFIVQACEALAEAHRIGIVHRDIKPANLFLTRRSDATYCVKLLDFGISKAQAPGVQGLTATRTTIGTSLYMPPEQIRSAKSVDSRADIWALGVTLFELLTGRHPFSAEDVAELAVKIVVDPPTPLSAVRPDLPRGLEAVILKCLEKTPTERYADVASLARALSPFASASTRVGIERVSRIVGQGVASDGSGEDEPTQVWDGARAPAPGTEYATPAPIPPQAGGTIVTTTGSGIQVVPEIPAPPPPVGEHSPKSRNVVLLAGIAGGVALLSIILIAVGLNSGGSDRGKATDDDPPQETPKKSKANAKPKVDDEEPAPRPKPRPISEPVPDPVPVAPPAPPASSSVAIAPPPPPAPPKVTTPKPKPPDDPF